MVFHKISYGYMSTNKFNAGPYKKKLSELNIKSIQLTDKTDDESLKVCMYECVVVCFYVSVCAKCSQPTSFIFSCTCGGSSELKF